MATSSVEFRLADVGEGLHEAEIKRWLVQPGDRVLLDQPIVEIETDKAVVELPSPVAGVINSLGGDEGAILHVGDIVAVLEPHGDAPPVAAPAPHAASPTSTSSGSSPPEQGAPRTGGRALATPAVRKLARDLNVDIATVAGSGPGGRVLASDVEASARAGTPGSKATASVPRVDAAAIPDRAPSSEHAPRRDAATPPIEAATAALQPPSLLRPPGPPLSTQPPSGGTRLPLRGLRRRIAQTMTQAWTTIPHITGFDEVDVTALVAMRERLRPLAEARGLRLTYLSFVVKAASIALREHPIVNASLDEERQEIVLHEEVNIGIATATPDGLIVPVVRGADGMTLLELQQAIDTLTERARVRSSTPEELHGGTFTVTNFGALGGWQAAPIIRPGEAAILGVGRVQERPWVVDGRVEPRPILALSLAADHRLIDGDVSTTFLARVGSLLSEPGLMLLELR